MNSRPDDRNINIGQYNKNKSQKIVNDNEISQLARNRTLLQEIDQELPGVSHFKCTLPISPFALLSPLQYFM
jgi:hypothetical protein